MSQTPPKIERLELEQFYHLRGRAESEGGMRTYLERHLAGLTKDEVVAALTASGYLCLRDSDPRVRQSHVDCAARTRGRFPLRWPEHWTITVLFDARDIFEAVRTQRAVEGL